MHYNDSQAFGQVSVFDFLVAGGATSTNTKDVVKVDIHTSSAD